MTCRCGGAGCDLPRRPHFCPVCGKPHYVTDTDNTTCTRTDHPGAPVPTLTTT